MLIAQGKRSDALGNVYPLPYALKGQKHSCGRTGTQYCINAFAPRAGYLCFCPFRAQLYRMASTQGAASLALGYEHIGLSARPVQWESRPQDAGQSPNMPVMHCPEHGNALYTVSLPSH